jgi:hypothetical protein
MSTKPSSPPTGFLSGKGTDAALVQKVIEKSKEGKLLWKRSGNTYEASTGDGSLSVTLEALPNALLGNLWSQFTVKNNYEEILRLQAQPNALLALSGLRPNPASELVDRLVEFLEDTRQSEVTKAISVLDNL